MTGEEIQRFLDMLAQDGISEVEAFRRLLHVLGLSYHGDEEDKTTGKTE